MKRGAVRGTLFALLIEASIVAVFVIARGCGEVVRQILFGRGGQ